MKDEERNYDETNEDLIKGRQISPNLNLETTTSLSGNYI